MCCSAFIGVMVGALVEHDVIMQSSHRSVSSVDMLGVA